MKKLKIGVIILVIILAMITVVGFLYNYFISPVFLYFISEYEYTQTSIHSDIKKM